MQCIKCCLDILVQGSIIRCVCAGFRLYIMCLGNGLKLRRIGDLCVNIRRLGLDCSLLLAGQLYQVIVLIIGACGRKCKHGICTHVCFLI